MFTKIIEWGGTALAIYSFWQKLQIQAQNQASIYNGLTPNEQAQWVQVFGTVPTGATAPALTAAPPVNLSTIESTVSSAAGSVVKAV